MQTPRGLEAEIALVAFTPDVPPQLRTGHEDAIAEDPAGEWAESSLHKKTLATEDGAWLLGQTNCAIGLSTLAVEKNGTTFEVFQVNPLAKLHQAQGFDNVFIGLNPFLFENSDSLIQEPGGFL